MDQPHPWAYPRSRNEPWSLLCALLLVTILCGGCSQSWTRELDETGVGDDGGDGGPPDTDVPPRLSECELIGTPRVIAESSTPFVTDTLGRFAVDVFALAGSEGPNHHRSGVIYLFDDERLELLTILDIDNAEHVSLRYDEANALLIAQVLEPGGVSFRAFELGWDWELTTHVEHDLCRGCSPAAGPPLPGRTYAATATVDLETSEVQLHIVSHRQDDPPIAGSQFTGEHPVVVRGSFGPMLLFWADGEIHLVRYHWDGEMSQEPVVIPGGPFAPNFAAVDGLGDEVLLAGIEETTTRQLVLIGLDDMGRRRARYELTEVGAADVDLALSVNREAYLVAWIDQDVDDPARRVARAAAVRRDGQGTALVATALGDPFAATPLPTITATTTDEGHFVIWSAGRGDGGADVLGRFIECQQQ